MREYNKIFNIGLNKAGTSSLSAALNTLGFKTAHFRHRGVRLFDVIRRNHQKDLPLMTGLDGFDAYSDFAGEYFFEVLDRQYPGSRFILTVRNPEQWLDSRERHVMRNRTNPSYRHAFVDVDREKWRQHMQRTIVRVRRHFAGRPRDLLIIDIPGGEGWNKLCPFLEVPEPAAPFPFKNRK